MKTGIVRVFILIGFSIIFLAQCNSSKDVSGESDSSTTEAMTVRLLLNSEKTEKYIVATYAAYGPEKVKPVSRSQNWYRVKFTKPGTSEQLIAKLESDSNIEKVELAKADNDKVQSSKSQGRAKSSPRKK